MKLNIHDQLKKRSSVVSLILFAVLSLLLAGCSTPETSPRGSSDPALQAQVTLVYAHATDTQVALQAQAQQATEQAYQYEIAATQAAQQTQLVQSIWMTTTAVAASTQAAATSDNMTAWAGVTSTALVATQDIERDKVNAKRTTIWAGAIAFVLFWVTLFAFAGVKIYDLYIDVRARKIRSEQVEPDMNGRYPAVNSKNLGSGKLILPNLAHRAVIDVEADDLTTEQALQNTAMHIALEQTRALATSVGFGRQMAKNLSPSPEPVDPGLSLTRPDLPLLADGQPSWSLIESWDGKGGIPYGVSGNGLEFLDLSHVPHGGVFGKTGEGKSRYFLRPFIAAALAAGARVLIMGKQADFNVFSGHPNVKMLPVQQFTNPDEAAKYAEFLKRIIEEMNRRDDYLVSHHASTWEKAGRESTLLVLDEMGNALAMMPTDVQKQAYRWVQGLVQEGRKAGFNVWMASQRAVGFKSIVEQLGRAVFHLADAEASRYALGFTGAEELDHGQFYAKFQRLHKCLAFDPSDEDIARFLEGRNIQPHEPIDWIDAEVVPLDQTQPVKTVNRPPAASVIEARIREVLERMRQEDRVSLSRAQRLVFGQDDPRGGAHFKQVQDVWVQMQAERIVSDTDTTASNNAPSGPFSGSTSSTATSSTD